MTPLGIAGFASCIIGTVLVGRKMAIGFLVSLIGHICWTIVGIRAGLPDLTWCSVAFACLSTWNFCYWVRLALRDP